MKLLRDLKQIKPTARASSQTLGRSLLLSLLLLLVLLLSPLDGFAQAKRLVIVKIDGLPYDLLDRLVKERDTQTTKSVLPWLDFVFYQHGTRLSNFYVRGMSLSAPSWSMLDTGQHLQIKGNVEFDRYTLHSYDYLNFIPFYLNGALGARIDMPAVEVLDSLGVPLLIDAYPNSERYITFSLYQRGPRYLTLSNSLQNRFKKPPKELFDEWTMGFEMRSSVGDQLLRELLAGLSDPKIRYLDIYLTDFDHIAHHNNDLQSQLFVLKQIDSMVGQIWSTIQKSPNADETAMVLVSDHGFNTDEKIYSQGFNLVKLLGSPQGGGHHVITKRRLMLDYSIKGVNPLVPLITTTTQDTYYLKGQSTDYPTAMLDFDGNERASVQLRDSDLNLLHILLQQLQREDLPANLREPVTKLFFTTIDRRRSQWQSDSEDLQAELGALRRSIEQQRTMVAALPKKFTREEVESGRDDAAKREAVQLDRWIREEHEYSEYLTTLQNLLALSPNFAPAKLKIADVIHKQAMGDPNSIYQLQNYIAGIGPAGLVLNKDGSLDMERSFVHINYFSLLLGSSVRNNVQDGISNRPIDMIATRLSANLIRPTIDEANIADDVIWVNGGPDKQALLMSRLDSSGHLSFRYQPIKNLTQDESGQLHFELTGWQPGLPLRLFEDPQLVIPSSDRAAWLSQWHTEMEWLRAIHKAHYSTGLIGLNEELARHPFEKLSPDQPGISDDEKLMRRFVLRQRRLVEPDLLIMANNHWNFDVRGFNPGGNHGSFFRISTHAVFMVCGGRKTGIAEGAIVGEPYDSLSFAPTMLALTGNLRDDSNPVPFLWEKGFRHFPGRVVKELLANNPGTEKITISGANSAP